MEYQLNAFTHHLNNTKKIFNSILDLCKLSSLEGEFDTLIKYNNKTLTIQNNTYKITPRMFDVLLDMFTDCGFTHKVSKPLFSKKTRVLLSWEPTDYVELYHKVENCNCVEGHCTCNMEHCNEDCEANCCDRPEEQSPNGEGTEPLHDVEL